MPPPELLAIAGRLMEKVSRRLTPLRSTPGTSSWSADTTVARPVKPAAGGAIVTDRDDSP